MSDPRHSPNDVGHDGTITIGAIARSHQAWADEQPTVQLCAFCPGFRFEGTAAECRLIFEQHLQSEHPEKVRLARLTPKQRKAENAKRANRDRAEREDADRLVKVERGRQRDALAAMDAGLPQVPVLEEAAADRLGPDGAASSSPDDERIEVVNECKIDGCTNDASGAPRMGMHAGKCAFHRAEVSRRASERMTGKGRGGKTASRAPRGRREAPPVPPEPQPEPVAETTPARREEHAQAASPLVRLLATLTTDDLASAIDELEHLRRRLDAEQQLIGQALDTKGAQAA